jgi:hypothetical protein
MVAGAIVPSAWFEPPKGVDLMGIQARYVSANYNGGTLQAVIEGTNWDGDLTAVPLAPDLITTLAEGSGVATGVDVVQALGGADQIVPIGQFRAIRLNVTVAAGPPDDGSIVTAHINGQYDQ